MNDSTHDWHVQLSPTLWAYCTSIHIPIGTTPYSLVFGEEAIIPLEVELPSLWVSLKDLISNEDYKVTWLQQLKLLDEKRRKAFDHLQEYQHRMSC